MKIAHFEASVDWGGQELRILEQTEWLNAHGHPTWIIARPGSAILDKVRERRLPVFELRVRGSLHPVTLRSLHKFLRRNQIELLDCHGSRESFYGTVIKFLTSVKIVRSLHVTDPLKTHEPYGFVWRHGNHGVIATAGKIRDMLIEQRLAPENKIWVSSPGVDPVRFNPNIHSHDIKKKLGIPVENPVVANIGMIRPDKGQLYYVAACRLLLEQGLPITCLQVGEATKQTSEYKEQVIKACGSHLNKGIYFLGYQDDIENYLALADVVVIASIATEAQTRLVSQAFFMKKNVVATTAGGLPEMITHQKTGLLCEPKNPKAMAEAIREILSNEKKRILMSAEAFHYAHNRFTFDNMMQNILQYYQKILSDSP